MSKEELLKCDVCHGSDQVSNQKMQMKRSFDSTDGRSYWDHFVIEEIDICDLCYKKTLQSRCYLSDYRVQGRKIRLGGIGS